MKPTKILLRVFITLTVLIFGQAAVLHATTIHTPLMQAMTTYVNKHGAQFPWLKEIDVHCIECQHHYSEGLKEGNKKPAMKVLKNHLKDHSLTQEDLTKRIRRDLTSFNRLPVTGLDEDYFQRMDRELDNLSTAKNINPLYHQTPLSSGYHKNCDACSLAYDVFFKTGETFPPLPPSISVRQNTANSLFFIDKRGPYTHMPQDASKIPSFSVLELILSELGPGARVLINGFPLPTLGGFNKHAWLAVKDRSGQIHHIDPQSGKLLKETFPVTNSPEGFNQLFSNGFRIQISERGLPQP